MSDASIDDTVPADTLAEGEATGDARSGDVRAPDVADVADAQATADDDGTEVLDGAGTARGTGTRRSPRTTSPGCRRSRRRWSPPTEARWSCRRNTRE